VRRDGLRRRLDLGIARLGASEAAWTQMIAVRNAMKPGLVAASKD
jgi:hypothetical protein